MTKNLFFDMDGTVTESRTRISSEMAGRLADLQSRGYTITIVSGATKEQMQTQLNGFKPSYILSQSGSVSPFWKKTLAEKEIVEINRHIKAVKKYLSADDIMGKNEDDLVQYRGAQVSFSLLGHNANLSFKKCFDPDGAIRAGVLKANPFFSNSLEVRIGGTTCLDYTHKDYTKGKSIERLIKYLDWRKDQSVYFGDALFKGGNDESVIGVIPTCLVGSPRDLLFALKDYLK